MIVNVNGRWKDTRTKHVGLEKEDGNGLGRSANKDPCADVSEEEERREKKRKEEKRGTKKEMPKCSVTVLVLKKTKKSLDVK